MPSVFDRKCFGSFFEYRFHAYSDLSWYFGFAFVLHAAFGIWGLIVIFIEDRDLKPDNQMQFTIEAANQEKKRIELFLQLASYGCFILAATALALTIAIPCLMRTTACAFFSLISMVLYALLILGRSGVLILGAVWVWGEYSSAANLVMSSDRLYNASVYLLASLIVCGVEITFGSIFLICCGLIDAVHEARMIFAHGVSDDEQMYYEPFLHGPQKR